MCNQAITGKCPCYAILQLIKEPIKSNPKSATQTDFIDLGYSYETCEKKISKLLKKYSLDIPVILENIQIEFGEIDFEHKFIFIHALVSAVCLGCLNQTTGLDELKFINLCSLLSIYIDGNEELEMQAFLAITQLQNKLSYQPGKN